MIRYLFREEVYLIDGEAVTSMELLENPGLQTWIHNKRNHVLPIHPGQKIVSDVSVDSKLQAAAEVLLDIAERHLKPLSQGSGTLEKIGDKRRG